MRHEITKNPRQQTLPADMYAHVCEMVVAREGHEPLYFDTPVPVLDVFNIHVDIYAVWCSPMGRIYIMENNPSAPWDSDLWPELKETDCNYNIVITALYNRLSAERRVAV